MYFYGFQRPNGSVGVRNILLVLAPVDCSYEPAKRIARSVEGGVAITQPYGCDVNQMVVNNFVGIAQNPNVAGILLVGEGCEALSVEMLSEKMSKFDKPLGSVVCQKDGGTLSTIRKGIKLLQKMAQQIEDKREPFDLSRLTVAFECGGSDQTSISANLASGVAADMIVEAGGTVIVSEPQEMVGTKHILVKRAVTKNVAKKIDRMITKYEKQTRYFSFLSKGNIEGGLTNIEQKARCSILKMGTKPIQGVLENSNRILERPSGKGLYLQDGVCHDVRSMTHMVAAGAQIVLFTTGRGATTGHAIAPVIKVTANSRTYSHMRDDLDIYAGTIIENKESIECVGRRIFDVILKVASGQETKSEIHRYRDFIIYKEDKGSQIINRLLLIPGGDFLFRLGKAIFPAEIS